MQQEIHLYIDNKEVFFAEPPEILFTFQRVDYTNPSVIKNSFTKTIQIEGVPENDKVFNEIWSLDRTQGDDLFNPSKRVPFELFSNGEKVETGYAKLDNVVRDGYKVQYEITLYGGLGDFFYGLSYGFDYDYERKADGTTEQAEDEELRLKDLTYISDAEDDTTEFNFNITKEAVYSAWSRLISRSSAKSMWDCINFAPAYNGLPEDFDSDKMLINTNGYSGGCRISVPSGASVDGTTYQTQQIVEKDAFPQRIEKDGNTYRTQNGYAMSELREDLTEWEARDLRSYLQRPLLRVKALFEAIKRYAKAKGEYTLNLDEDFFNENNPYYEKAWITLPMLQNLNGEYAEQEVKGVLGIGVPTSSENIDRGYARNYYQKRQVTKYNVVGLPTATTYKGASIKMKLQVAASRVNSFGSVITKLFSSINNVDYRTEQSKPIYTSMYDVQLIAYNESNEEVSRSKHHCFSTATNGMPYVDRYGENDGYGVIAHGGCFVNEEGTSTSGTFTWKSDDGLNTNEYVIELEDKGAEYASLVLVVTKRIQYNTAFATSATGNVDFYNLLIDNYLGVYGVPLRLNIWKSTQYQNTVTDSTVIYKPENDTMKSHQLITKAKLLSQDGTPAKYMIDYCKLFNLYFDKDPIEKVVTIRTRRNFYDENVVNLENNIDRKSPIQIKPLAFDNKWYDFNYTEGDRSECGGKYYSTWGTDYGKQKVNTGYNFDNSSNNLLEDNIYENGVETQEKSRYFSLKIKDRKRIPAFLGEWSDYKLFNVTESSVESNDEFYVGQPSGVTGNQFKSYGTRYDLFPKLQFHTTENSPIDGSNVLVFFNGVKKTTIDGSTDSVNYYITDDTAEMMSLNGNQSCWLYTNSATDASGNEIAKMLTITDRRSTTCALPCFTRNVILDDKIAYTWDFGKANELFVPNAKYLDSNVPTLYERFWKGYISDLYAVTTRIVTAYVKLNGKVEGDWLKHFYYFDNSIWCLTKIEDYNITSFGTTKCEFAKVGSMADYRKWYNWGITYNNVSLWIEPDAGGNYHFSLSKALSTDITIKLSYTDHRDATATDITETYTIDAGATASGDLTLTQQDFDVRYSDTEVRSITFADVDGNEVVNGFTSGLDWLYVDRAKFTDFVEDLESVQNSYGIQSVTQWGTRK